MDVLKLLLDSDVPNVREKLPTGAVKVKRLSEKLGKPVVFSLRGLGYNEVSDIVESNTRDRNVHIVLAGVTAPNLRDKSLMEKFGAETPAELVKAMLTPGEIEDISRAVEKLCGYRTETIQEIKNA